MKIFFKTIKKYLLCCVLTIYLSSIVFPVETKKNNEEEINNYFSEYLGIELLFSVQLYQDLDFSISPKDTPFLILLPLRLEGAASNYAILTSIDLFSDLIQISRYYQRDISFLEKQPLLFYSYSYLNFDISYLVTPLKSTYKLLIGLDFGHYGFLSLNFSPTSYALTISPLIEFKWIIQTFVIYSIKIEVPIAVYKKNIESYFQFKFNTWFSFEPFANIENSSSFSFRYHLGLKFEYNRLRSVQNTEALYQHINLFPYIKISFIY